MLRTAASRLIPGLAETAAPRAAQTVAAQVLLADATTLSLPRAIAPLRIARRPFSATSRSLQEDKKAEENGKPAEEAKQEGAAASGAEEELKKQIVAKDKRIAELQVGFEPLGCLVDGAFIAMDRVCSLWTLLRFIVNVKQNLACALLGS